MINYKQSAVQNTKCAVFCARFPLMYSVSLVNFAPVMLITVHISFLKSTSVFTNTKLDNGTNPTATTELPPKWHRPTMSRHSRKWC